MKTLSSLMLGLLVFQSTAHATNSINVQTFNPSTSDHFVLLEDGFKSEWPKSASYYLGANYNYADAPLVALNANQSAKMYNIVDSIQTFDLFIGFKLSNSAGMFLGAPIHTVNFSSTSPTGFPKGSTTAFGDVKALIKIRLTEDTSNTAVALVPEIHLPTGSTSSFSSDASTYLAARLAVERQFDAWSLLGNIGFGSAPNSIYSNPAFAQTIDYSKRFIVGIGGFIPFNEQWGMNLEFNNISMLPFDKSLNPNDAYLGVRYAANDSLVFTGGASVGEIGGAGGQNLRGIVGIRYTPFDEKQQAPRPLAKAEPSPAPEAAPAPEAVATAPVTPTTRAVIQGKRIEILSPINFENNSYKLLPDSKQTLDDVGALMIDNQANFKKVYIDGHTNNIGNEKHNLSLSLARAKSVKSYLVSKGVPATSLEARGFGSKSPKVPYKTNKKALEINRRVEFIIVK